MKLYSPSKSFFLMALALCFFLSCKESTTQTTFNPVHTYDEALQRWQQLNIKHYSIYQAHQIGPWGEGRYKLIIHFDSITEVRTIDRDSLLPGKFGKTIDDLFSYVDEISLRDSTYCPRYDYGASFDSIYGYPNSCGYTCPYIFDVNEWYSTWNFQEIK
jgi:hypothetical protein